MSTTPTWHDKLIGGFKRTSDRLVGNLAGLGGARLDDSTLDDIEEALIASDLGPETAGRIRHRLSEGSFERNMEELGIRVIVAEEVEKVLAQLNDALELQSRSLLQFTQASASMFGLEVQGVAEKLWLFARSELEDTKLLVEKITALGGDPTTTRRQV